MTELNARAQRIRRWHDKIFKEYNNADSGLPWSYYLARAIDIEFPEQNNNTKVLEKSLGSTEPFEKFPC